MVAKEWRSGLTLRLWEDQLPSTPPFDIGPDTLLIAYSASAELGCFLMLGWELPENVLDLYVEFHARTNIGVPRSKLSIKRSLLGALSHFNLLGICLEEKQEMQDLALRGGNYTAQEKHDLLVYCESDVIALEQLLPKMLPRINLNQALIRGWYTHALATMEHNGIPLDLDALTILRTHWEEIKLALIAQVDAQFQVYEGITFKTDRFVRYLRKHQLEWLYSPSGEPKLDAPTFRDMSKVYPQIHALGQLRHAISSLRLEGLKVGTDGRNRAQMRGFGTKTSRNTPSNVEYIYGPSRWLRCLIT